MHSAHIRHYYFYALPATERTVMAEVQIGRGDTVAALSFCSSSHAFSTREREVYHGTCPNVTQRGDQITKSHTMSVLFVPKSVHFE